MWGFVLALLKAYFVLTASQYGTSHLLSSVDCSTLLAAAQSWRFCHGQLCSGREGWKDKGVQQWPVSVYWILFVNRGHFVPSSYMFLCIYTVSICILQIRIFDRHWLYKQSLGSNFAIAASTISGSTGAQIFHSNFPSQLQFLSSWFGIAESPANLGWHTLP